MVTRSDTAIGQALTDELLEHHDAWRHDAEAVQRAYDAWIGAERANRELAYAGYLAALDQEQLAADAYREQLAWLRRFSGTRQS
jgi:hypothetical protein